MNRTAVSIIATVTPLTITVSLAQAGDGLRRENRQDARIALAHEQRSIDQDRQSALANGSINRGERAQLTREQDHASRDIYPLKHDRRAS